MPRFQEPHFSANLKLLSEFSIIARECDCTMAQLALAWLLARDDIIVPIPGTTKLDHLEENAGAAHVRLSAQAMARLDALINAKTVSGARYNATTQAEIDTEILSARMKIRSKPHGSRRHPPLRFGWLLTMRQTRDHLILRRPRPSSVGLILRRERSEPRRIEADRSG